MFRRITAIIMIVAVAALYMPMRVFADETDFEEHSLLKAAVSGEIEAAQAGALSSVLAGVNKSKWAYGSDFGIISLARGDKNADNPADSQITGKKNIDKYCQSIADVLTKNKSDMLKENMATDNAKAVLTMTSLGMDPEDINGHNLLKPLADMTYVSRQGLNGIIWTLIAVDCHNYEIPQCENPDNQATRDKLIGAILASKHEDGGWSYSGALSDPDMTAMAIQALAPYYGKEGFEQVTEAAYEALAYLSGAQNFAGGFTSGGVVTSESASQVIIALCSIGVDPESDPRFIKNGKSVMDSLMSFKTSGGFKHISSNTSANALATTQGYQALVAFERMSGGKSGLYDMNDIGALTKADIKTDGGDKDNKPGEKPGNKPSKDPSDNKESNKLTGKTKSLGTLKLSGKSSEEENTSKDETKASKSDKLSEESAGESAKTGSKPGEIAGADADAVFGQTSGNLIAGILMAIAAMALAALIILALRGRKEKNE